MKYDTPFELISIEFDRYNIPVLLIGGFAVNYYNISRQTADIDFLIDENDYGKVKKILNDAGYKEVYSEKLFARFSNSKDQLHLLDIDFMFVNRDTLEEMIKNGEEATIARCIFIVPSLEHLIALKLHSIKFNPDQREYKDLVDILSLVEKNDMKVNSREFKERCLKYGTEEIYNKILTMLNKEKK